MPQIMVTPGASTSLSSSSPSSKASVKQPPRPQNAWILYRQWALTRLLQEEPELKGVPQAQLSKRLGAMWKEADAETRGFFEYEANLRKEQHAVEHPNYVFKPVKRTDKEREREERKREKARTKEAAKLEKQRRRVSGRGSVSCSDAEDSFGSAFGNDGPSPPLSACPSRGGTPEPLDSRTTCTESMESIYALLNGYKMDSTLSWSEYRNPETCISESPVSMTFPVSDFSTSPSPYKALFAAEAFHSPPDSLSPVSPLFPTPDLLSSNFSDGAMPSITVADSFNDLCDSTFDDFEIAEASSFNAKGMTNPYIRLLFFDTYAVRHRHA